MTRFWLILFALIWCCAAPVLARPQGTARVTAQMTTDGVRASVVLSRPVVRFAFADADVVREGELELLTPGLTFSGNAITGSQPFRRFDLRIRPTTEERDAKYPAHYRLGEGGVLYVPALKANATDWRTVFTFKTTPGQVRVPASGDVSDGFVFIGPVALRSEYQGVIVIAAPETPPWLLERTKTDLVGAVATYTAALGVPLPRKPLLIVKHQDGPRKFNVGDVTPGAVTALRFHGSAWERHDAGSAKAIGEFIFHEAFHFWNGGLARADDAQTWLHEGGAEYASLLGNFKAGVLIEEDVRRRLSTSLQRCRSGLQNEGDKGLAAIRFLSNQVRYPCGMILQWATDLHMRRASSGKRTVMDAWADTIRTARQRPSKRYGLSDFYSAAGITDGAALRPASLLVDQSGPERWTALPAALNALGAEVSQISSPVSRRGVLLFHLLRQNCPNLPNGSSFGFYADGNRVKLDSPAGCGALAGNPVLVAVEGGDPFDMSADTYEAVQRRCAASADVTLTTADGRPLSAVCAKPLGPAPLDYVVQRWLGSPVPS